MNKIDRIKELENLIKYHSEKYYSGNPIISDTEFDNLVEELKTLNPNSETLNKSGFGYQVSNERRKIKHTYKMTGMNKYKLDNPEDRLDLHEYITVSLKLDGGAVEIVYSKEGDIESASTRGNGEYGLDVLSRVRDFVPQKINTRNSKVTIYGEFVHLIHDNSEDYGLRNKANGFLNRLSTDISEEELFEYEFVSYKIRSSDFIFSREDEFKVLKDLGFKVAPNIVLHSYETFQSYNELIERLNPRYYPYDGIVLSKSDKSDIAYKYNREGKVVTINSIDWGMSPQGKFTPVANFDTVVLSGANVSRVTLNNYKNVVDNGIGIGSKIRVTRSGEVIPYVCEVVETSNNFGKFIEDFKCPYCHYDLSKVGVDLKCTNENCTKLKTSRLKQFLSGMFYFKGLGSNLVDNLIEFMNVYSIEDFLYLIKVFGTKLQYRASILPESSTQKKCVKFFELVNTSKLPLSTILSSLSIRGIGNSAASKLESLGFTKFLKENHSVEEIKQKLISYNLGAITKEIVLNAELIKRVCEMYLKDLEELKEIEIPQVKVIITGKLNNFTRSELVKTFNLKEVSKFEDCDYFINNEPNSNSSKNKNYSKYLEKGNPSKLVSEKEFLEIMNNS